jgi:hypothetical protein
MATIEARHHARPPGLPCRRAALGYKNAGRSETVEPRPRSEGARVGFLGSDVASCREDTRRQAQFGSQVTPVLSYF